MLRRRHTGQAARRWASSLWPFTLVAAGLLLGVVRAAEGPHFRADDPLRVDPDTAVDASGVSEQELSQFFDFLHQTFVRPGERRDVEALNVNTMDEVPDSMWFVDRIGRGPLSIGDIVRGPDARAALTDRDWIVVGAKNSGLQPGFRAVSADDATGQLYQIEFDPPDYPELATGAEIIGTAIYHALGYHVVENYLVTLDPARVTIGPKATIRDAAGRNRPFTRDDLDAVLRRAARKADGTYRGLASKFAPGEPRGAFRYYGTRPDDPNDIYPHEHRRELRGARVFGAWVQHDDSRSNNTLDMLEGPPGGRYLRHYMFDFGSIMGSATTGPNAARSGHEYLIQRDTNLRTLYTFGLMPPAWARRGTGRYAPAAGPFSAEGFDPAKWRPEYRNPAFENMQPSDAFWAARRVAAFTDAQLRAIVDKARYTDPAATEQIAGALALRRDLIARTWLTAVNPIVAPSLAADGTLRFGNAAVDAQVVTSPVRYELQWSHFDNVTRAHVPAGPPQQVQGPTAVAPAAVLTGSEFVAVTVRTVHPDHPHWSVPVELYFRRDAGGWTPVGLMRQASGK
jgi:hypothetical protein